MSHKKSEKPPGMRANLFHRKVLECMTRTPDSNFLHGERGLDIPQRASEGA